MPDFLRYTFKSVQAESESSQQRFVATGLDLPDPVKVRCYSSQ